jgi:DNA-binding PadR family transcriptional regulator
MDIKTLCLGILSLGPASGYEIRKQFEDGPFAYFYDAGFGSIYPALNRLSAEGLVSCTEMPQEGRPDKKVYSVTDAGLEAFRAALHRPPAPDKMRSEALVALFFGHLLDVEPRRSVYDAYLTRLREHVRFLSDDELCREAGMADLPGHRFVNGFGLAIYRAALEFMEDNRHMLFDDESAVPPAKTGTDA